MFNEYFSLINLDISSFYINNEISVSGMFKDCGQLRMVKINKVNIKKIKEIINISKIKF
jgi:hypothetical protein